MADGREAGTSSSMTSICSSDSRGSWTSNWSSDYPASTAHSQFASEELQLTSMTRDMICLSIKHEHVDDFVEGLDRALLAACKP
jgi:hypothetical protein